VPLSNSTPPTESVDRTSDRPSHPSETVTALPIFRPHQCHHINALRSIGGTPKPYHLPRTIHRVTDPFTCLISKARPRNTKQNRGQNLQEKGNTNTTWGARIYIELVNSNHLHRTHKSVGGNLNRPIFPTGHAFCVGRCITNTLILDPLSQIHRGYLPYGD